MRDPEVDILDLESVLCMLARMRELFLPDTLLPDACGNSAIEVVWSSCGSAIACHHHQNSYAQGLVIVRAWRSEFPTMRGSVMDSGLHSVAWLP